MSQILAEMKSKRLQITCDFICAKCDFSTSKNHQKFLSHKCHNSQLSPDSNLKQAEKSEQKPPQTFYCDQCDFSTAKFKALSIHNRRSHLTGNGAKKVAPKPLSKLNSVKNRKLKTMLKSMNYHQTQIQIKSKTVRSGQKVVEKARSEPCYELNTEILGNANLWLS